MAHSRLPNSTNRMVSTPDVRLATLMDLPQLTPTKSALDAKYDTYQK